MSKQPLPAEWHSLKTCEMCHGKGYYLAMGEETCGSCFGSGRDLRSTLYHGTCKTCNGKGRYAYCRNVTCKKCGGTGKRIV